MKRIRSLWPGILLGITAIVAMGIVYIDTTSNSWRLGGTGNGFVQLIVSNRLVMSVSTNTGRIGINVTNANAFSLAFEGIPPATNATGNGASASTTGGININGARGGGTFATTTATGGTGGRHAYAGGPGGDAPLATTNSTGGIGGSMNFFGGNGGGSASTATNATTGGTGGNAVLGGGTGGTPLFASTNTVGGDGGTADLEGGAGGTPNAGMFRKGGGGGTATVRGGNGGNGVNTNAGPAGNVNLTGGNSGSATAGNPSPGGLVNITGGNGSTGLTNSDGGHVFIAGGAPGAGAVPGNVVLARTSAGVSRGAGVEIGPFISGGSVAITNVLGGVAALDFGSVAAGAFEDLPIAVMGATSNNCAVSLSIPWQMAQTGGAFVAFASNDVIYCRFVNNQLAAAIDPSPGVVSAVVFRIR